MADLAEKFKKEGNNKAVTNVTRAMNENIAAWEKLTGKKFK